MRPLAYTVASLNHLTTPNAVAAKHNGEWKIFTGNEIGAIFGSWAWETFVKKFPEGDKSKACMLSSTVSSMVLKTMAAKEGFLFEDTLTGFKWLGNRARQLEAEGHRILMCFEEAIGFAHGSAVVDKDGVSAAVIMAELVNELAAQGITLVDQLHKVYGARFSTEAYARGGGIELHTFAPPLETRAGV